MGKPGNIGFLTLKNSRLLGYYLYNITTDDQNLIRLGSGIESRAVAELQRRSGILEQTEFIIFRYRNSSFNPAIINIEYID